MKKFLLFLLAVLMLLVPVSADIFPEIEAGIASISKYGNIVLSAGAESMKELGYGPADIITVKINDIEIDMPIGTDFSDVDSGEPVCCFRTNSLGNEVVELSINAGNFASFFGIGEYRVIDEEPGFEVVYFDGFDASTSVVISMAETQGFADEYTMHHLGTARTHNREDYADLSDEEYANFRVVETSGMGTNTLFRSSSPINPALNRNEEADQALLNSLVRTVMNMADTEETMKKFADYNLTNYSSCDIIALNMGMDFFSEEFQEKLAEGFRYMASHDGPYLIHCVEGKDRTGFAAAVLECLMGATADEVVGDYMLTYFNFYGIELGTEQYRQIAAGNIEATLSRAFGIGSIREDGIDLSVCAGNWLESLGVSREEISALKEKLAEDYGGLNV